MDACPGLVGRRDLVRPLILALGLAGLAVARCGSAAADGIPIRHGGPPIRSTSDRSARAVAEERSEPPFRFLDADAAPVGVGLDLVPADRADAEVARLGM